VNGSPQEFEAFCLKHGDAVRRSLGRFAADADHLDDLEQATWVRCYERWDQLKHDDRLPWVISVGCSVAMDEIRRIRRREALDVGLVPEKGPDNHVVPDTLRQLESKEILARVQGLMNEELTEREESIVRLRFFDGYVNSEVAKRLGISASTVRVHLSSGLGKLKKALRPEPQ